MRLAAVIGVLGLLETGVGLAQDATPEAPVATPNAAVAVGAPVRITLVEHATNVTTTDQGEPGPSPGDMILWGPDPLFDETNTADTGAVTYGMTVIVNPDGERFATITFIFPDGSTIEAQGIESGGTTPSVKTITGGSGAYLGARGTLTDTPSEDRSTWTHTFELWP
jgi:hypothetical protein